MKKLSLRILEQFLHSIDYTAKISIFLPFSEH